MSDTTSVLHINRLTVQYGDRKVLDEVSLFLFPGQTLGIAGASGSGKSTLALAIPGLLSAAAQVQGNIVFKGKSLSERSSAQLLAVRGAEIGFIFQEPQTALNPLLPCGTQVSEVIQQHQHCSAKEAHIRTLEWFQKVQLSDPDSTFHAYPHQLSGGQQQRVMIAMALCCNPTLLIADEAVTALDATVQKSILDLLKKLQQELHLTILFISHDMSVIRYIADEIAVMHEGKIVEQGPVDTVLSAPAHAHTRELLRYQSLPPHSAPTATASEPMFQSGPVTVRYPVGIQWPFVPKKTFTAVDGAEIKLFPGECLGVVGESGSGKSSLAREVFQLMGGAQAHVAFISQHPHAALNPRMTIGNAVMEPLLVHRFAQGKAEARQQTVALLASVGLDEGYFDRYPHELSGGQKQRVCIARALAVRPQVLICDEIVSALDVSVQWSILELLEGLRQQYQLTVLFISHDLEVIRRICNRVMVMYQGKIVETNTVEQLFNAPKSAYTQELLAAILP